MKTFNVIVEIPKGSNMKYEYNKAENRFYLDRILYGSNVYPANYGFLENTLELDGDPIDVMILMTQPVFPGCVVEVKIIGGLEMIDEGEVDNKIIGVCATDFEWNHFNDINAVPSKIKDKIYDFFANYKTLEKKEIMLKDWYNKATAETIIKEAKARFLKNKNN